MFKLPPNKTEARQKALKARQALPDGIRFAAEQAIAEGVLTLLAQHKQRHVAGYAAIRGEVDCKALLQDLKRKGYVTSLPVVKTGKAAPLVFRRCDPDTDKMSSGPFGIPEPDQACPEIIPDILLVPLVGFDPACHRIGYGAGFYDRTIAHYQQAGHPVLTIGLGFDCQKFDKIDAKAHDQPLDYIVTEVDVYHSSA